MNSNSVPVIILILTVIPLVGAGCFFGSQTMKPDLSDNTPQEVVEVLKLQLEYLAEHEPNISVVVQVTFEEPQQYSSVKEVLEDHRLELVQFVGQQDANGYGFIRIPEDQSALEYLDTFHERQRAQFAHMLEVETSECEQTSDPGACGSVADLLRALEQHDASGELQILSIGVKGLPADALDYWNQVDKVFAVEVEPSGRVQGRPLTPTTKLENWW